MGEQADGGAHDLVVSRPSEITRGAVEVLDPSFDYWLARFEVADDITPGPGDRTASPAAIAALSAMVARLPELQIMLGQTNVLRVVFSPEIQRALASGQATLMQSAQFALPVAVNHSGQIMGMARVAGGTGAKAGGGIALGAAATIAWPVLLASAVAIGAAMAQQKWLENTLGRLEEALARIENRLRDDDHGALEAAEHLAALVEPFLASGLIPAQLRLELAVARQDVEGVYYSRRRFVERFKRDLEKEQTERRSKESTSAWTSRVTGELADRKSGVVDELLIFLRAMVCRARLTTATASALAAEGDGETALRLMDHLDEDLRRDYHDLHNRIAALARTLPDAPLWQRVPVLSSSGLPKVSSAEREQAHAMVSRIAKLMEQTVGASLPERDAGVSMLVSADSLRPATAGDA